MKQATTSKQAIRIFKAIEPRLKELWNKLIKGDFNDATQFAYEIGFVSDIDGELKKMGIHRTSIKVKNVEELEDSDFEDIQKLMKGGGNNENI